MKTLTVFAGPNGSGKTTITNRFLEDPPFALGHYLNPDEIEQQLNLPGFAVLESYTIQPSDQDWASFIAESTLAAKICRDNTLTSSQLTESIQLTDEGKTITPLQSLISDTYTSALITDFVRQMLIQAGQSFTFETVMSSADKIDTIRRAKELGYFVRLFYVTTRSPEINVSRVLNRVQKGGHFVPLDKIRERYWRSLDNLAGALRLADEAYLYDNSTDGSESLEIARLENDALVVTSALVPDWYVRYVEQKLT